MTAKIRPIDSNSFLERERSMAMKVLVSLVLFCSLPLSVAAQEPNRSRGQGYIFFAPGVGNIFERRATLQFGAGGEGFVYNGLGIGVEIAPVGPWSVPSGSQFSLGWIDYVVGVGSANLSYHFLPATTDRQLEPFVTAGYNVFFRAGVTHGANVGAGINIWLKRNVAMRFEVRDQQSWYRDNLSLRLGVTFR
jgi:hypothetical protein